MRNALKSLLKMKFISFLIILQLSFGLSMVTSVIYLHNTSEGKYNIFTSMFDINNTYLVRINIEDGPADLTYKFSQELNNLKSNETIKNSYCYFNNPLLFENIQRIVREDYKSLDIRVVDKFLTTIAVDENFCNRYTLDCSEGRSFISTDFKKDCNNDEIPILLGSDYKGKINIGDTFKEKVMTNPSRNRNDVSFKVTGFLKENSLVTLMDKEKLFDSVTFSNSIVVIPTIDNCFVYSRGVALSDVGLFLELRPTTNFDSINDKILKIIEKENPENKYKINYSFINLKDDMTNIKDNLSNNVDSTLYLGIALIALSIIGIIATLFGELKKRTKEFSVRMTCGATVLDLCIEFFLEVFLLILISVLISNIYLKLSSTDFIINVTLILKEILVILVLSMITSILPIIKMRKLTIINFFKE